jgi:hypothetical protein
MAELTSLSDDQLLALYHNDFSNVSDDDLRAMHASTDPAPDIGRGRESMVSALRGIPIAGAYADKGAAAFNAAASGLGVDTGLSNADNFSDRMAENEKTIGRSTDAFEKANPIGTTIGKIAIGVRLWRLPSRLRLRHLVSQAAFLHAWPQAVLATLYWAVRMQVCEAMTLVLALYSVAC